MADAAMGKIGASAPPSGNKLGAIGNVASAIGGMLGPSTTPSAIGPSGGQPLTAGTSNQLNNALSTLDQTLGTSDEDNDLPIRGNWY